MKNDKTGMQQAGKDTASSMVDGSAEEVAGYIADMVLELRNLAADKQMDFLAYLLEMSFQEAFDLAQKGGGDKK